MFRKLVSCSDCGQTISRRAASCPQCGAPGPARSSARANANAKVHRRPKAQKSIVARAFNCVVAAGLITGGGFVAALFVYGAWQEGVRQEELELKRAEERAKKEEERRIFEAEKLAFEGDMQQEYGRLKQAIDDKEYELALKLGNKFRRFGHLGYEAVPELVLFARKAPLMERLEGYEESQYEDRADCLKELVAIEPGNEDFKGEYARLSAIVQENKVQALEEVAREALQGCDSEDYEGQLKHLSTLLGLRPDNKDYLERHERVAELLAEQKIASAESAALASLESLGEDEHRARVSLLKELAELRPNNTSYRDELSSAKEALAGHEAELAEKELIRKLAECSAGDYRRRLGYLDKLIVMRPEDEGLREERKVVKEVVDRWDAEEAGEAARKSRERAAERRKKLISKQFSAWDGSHRGLEKFIKRNMNDPDSYDHVRTTYADQGSHLIVRTEFRGKNAFGGVVKNWLKAKVDLKGNVLQVVDQGP